MDIQEEISLLKERNKRVEQDKAWEVSFARRVSIFIITYSVAWIWLLIIDESDAFLKALVPAFGYVLSTISIPVIKKRWLKKQ